MLCAHRASSETHWHQGAGLPWLLLSQRPLPWTFSYDLDVKTLKTLKALQGLEWWFLSSWVNPFDPNVHLETILKIYFKKHFINFCSKVRLSRKKFANCNWPWAKLELAIHEKNLLRGLTPPAKIRVWKRRPGKKVIHHVRDENLESSSAAFLELSSGTYKERQNTIVLLLIWPSLSIHHWAQKPWSEHQRVSCTTHYAKKPEKSNVI